ncbi:hypothetical protein M885DRAFT_533976 [Pelagophyceae sp. CCMP2097]|nr:hypothetical protein M885DRAFT_533976 [Pelagophyceae sp. CCMP2097]
MRLRSAFHSVSPVRGAATAAAGRTMRSSVSRSPPPQSSIAGAGGGQRCGDGAAKARGVGSARTGGTARAWRAAPSVAGSAIGDATQRGCGGVCSRGCAESPGTESRGTKSRGTESGRMAGAASEAAFWSLRSRRSKRVPRRSKRSSQCFSRWSKRASQRDCIVANAARMARAASPPQTSPAAAVSGVVVEGASTPGVVEGGSKSANTSVATTAAACAAAPRASGPPTNDAAAGGLPTSTAAHRSAPVDGPTKQRPRMRRWHSTKRGGNAAANPQNVRSGSRPGSACVETAHDASNELATAHISRETAKTSSVGPRRTGAARARAAPPRTTTSHGPSGAGEPPAGGPLNDAGPLGGPRRGPSGAASFAPRSMSAAGIRPPPKPLASASPERSNVSETSGAATACAGGVALSRSGASQTRTKPPPPRAAATQRGSTTSSTRSRCAPSRTINACRLEMRQSRPWSSKAQPRKTECGGAAMRKASPPATSKTMTSSGPSAARREAAAFKAKATTRFAGLRHSSACAARWPGAPPAPHDARRWTRTPEPASLFKHRVDAARSTDRHRPCCAEAPLAAPSARSRVAVAAPACPRASSGAASRTVGGREDVAVAATGGAAAPGDGAGRVVRQRARRRRGGARLEAGDLERVAARQRGPGARAVEPPARVDARREHDVAERDPTRRCHGRRRHRWRWPHGRRRRRRRLQRDRPHDRRPRRYRHRRDRERLRAPQ